VSFVVYFLLVDGINVFFDAVCCCTIHPHIHARGPLPYA
jgi:hypothetical protein